MSESIISIQHIANSGKIVTTKEDSYIEINKVRISPAKIVFEDAFVGRKYCKEIVIQNYGNHMAYVTLFIPTSIVSIHLKFAIFFFAKLLFFFVPKLSVFVGNLFKSLSLKLTK